MTHGKLIARNKQVLLQQNAFFFASTQCSLSLPHKRRSKLTFLYKSVYNCLEDRTPDQPLASTETEAAPVLRTQPPASLPEKAVSLAEERRSWPPRTRQHQQHPALSSSVHPLIFSWPSIDTIAAAVKICTTVQPTNRAGLS